MPREKKIHVFIYIYKKINTQVLFKPHVNT